VSNRAWLAACDGTPGKPYPFQEKIKKNLGLVLEVLVGGFNVAYALFAKNYVQFNSIQIFY